MNKFLNESTSFSLPPGTQPTTTMRMLHGAYQSAKMIEAAESGSGGMVKTVCCPGSPKCHYCHGPASSPLKPLVCSGCRALIYCSRKCQVADWKNPKRPHKLWCARNKEYMSKHTYFLSQITQFPWSRIEPDGTFSHRIFEARLGVYGPGLAFGFWSVPVGRDFHDDNEEGLPHPPGYIHGEMMLRGEWPGEVDAWMLERMNSKGDVIPRLEFTNGFRPPRRVGVGEIRDWKGWYEWRGLSLASPAALLMHYPLSVYHILVDILQVVKNSESDERQALQVHYIGVEKELNHLPLFSELALLLPNVDLTLTFFGKPAYDLVKKAHKNHPGSLATKDPVWRYTAPQETGGGSVEIKLYSKSKHWTVEEVLNRELPKPDAMVGLNAGLSSYEEWMEPVRGCFLHSIPFATTDYDEADSQFIAHDILTSVDAIIKAAAGAPKAKLETLSAGLPTRRTFEVTANPFHMPGKPQVGSVKLPAASNGFVLPVFRGC